MLRICQVGGGSYGVGGQSCRWGRVLQLMVGPMGGRESSVVVEDPKAINGPIK